MQEKPDPGWQNLVNNGWLWNVDGLGVHLTVSGALSISWQMRIYKVRNTRLTFALHYQTQIGHHSEWESGLLPGGWGGLPGQTLGGLDSLKFSLSRGFLKSLIHFKILLFLVHVRVTEHPKPEGGWFLKWREVCQESRKSRLKSDVFTLCFLSALFLATFHIVLLSIYTLILLHEPLGDREWVLFILLTAVLCMQSLWHRMCPINKRGRRKKRKEEGRESRREKGWQEEERERRGREGETERSLAQVWSWANSNQRRFFSPMKFIR